VGYTDIYDYLVCSSTDPSCDGKPANAFKSLDALRMMFAEGWMSSLAKQQEKVEIYEQRMVQRRKRMQAAAASNQSTAEDCKIKTAVSSTMNFMLNAVEKQEGDECLKFFC